MIYFVKFKKTQNNCQMNLCEKPATFKILLCNDKSTTRINEKMQYEYVKFFNIIDMCNHHTYDFPDYQEVTLRFFIKLLKKAINENNFETRNNRITINYLESLLNKENNNEF